MLRINTLIAPITPEKYQLTIRKKVTTTYSSLLLSISLRFLLRRPSLPLASLAMASGGPSSSPVPSSWMEIVVAVNNRLPSLSPLVGGPVLCRLKASTSEFICFNGNAMARARLHFQHSLISKFFEKLPPFEQIKEILQTRWAEFGEVVISDLSNGYLLLRCELFDLTQKLLFEGPWSVNGAIL